MLSFTYSNPAEQTADRRQKTTLDSSKLCHHLAPVSPRRQCQKYCGSFFYSELVILSLIPGKIVYLLFSLSFWPIKLSCFFFKTKVCISDVPRYKTTCLPSYISYLYLCCFLCSGVILYYQS